MLEDELKLYYQLYTDVWRFFKKFSNVEDTELFWNTVRDDGEKIADGYKDTVAVKTAVKLVTDTYLALEDVWSRKYDIDKGNS